MLVSRLIRELAVVLVCSILVYSPVLGLPRARNDRLGPMPRRATLQAITRITVRVNCSSSFALKLKGCSERR